MKRAVVFAHYDKDAVIDDYVIFYLKSLKQAVGKVIFVSCNELGSAELSKLDNIADNIIAEPHSEYDFGSYKRGFEVIKNEVLSNYEEIIFANDSVYGPFFPIEDILEQMEEKDCDFWGITKNTYGLNGKAEHIQSYFITFRKNVFMSNEFINFIGSVKEEKSKNDIVNNYEIGLSEMLYKNGFKDAVYITAYPNISNCTIKKWKEVITKYKMPFLKCSVARLKNTNYTTADGWQETVENTGYPLELIEKNLVRTQETSNRELRLSTKTKEFIYNSLNYMPHKWRVPFISFLRKICSTVS